MVQSRAALQESVLGGLAVNEELIMIGASHEPLEVSPNFFSPQMNRLSGTSFDSQDTLSFSNAFWCMRSMNQVIPLESVGESFDLMMGGKERFRAVLTTED